MNKPQVKYCYWRVWRRGAWELCNREVQCGKEYCDNHEKSAKRAKDKVTK